MLCGRKQNIYYKQTTKTTLSLSQSDNTDPNTKTEIP